MRRVVYVMRTSLPSKKGPTSWCPYGGPSGSPKMFSHSTNPHSPTREREGQLRAGLSGERNGNRRKRRD